MLYNNVKNRNYNHCVQFRKNGNKPKESILTGELSQVIRLSEKSRNTHPFYRPYYDVLRPYIMIG